MRFTYLTIFCFCSIYFAFGQNFSGIDLDQYDKIIMRQDTSYPHSNYWCLTDSTVIENPLFKASYQFRYIEDIENRNVYATRMILECGVVNSVYYSLIRRYHDRVQTAVRKMMANVPVGGGMGYTYTETEEDKQLKLIAGDNRINTEIWINRNKKNLIERFHDYDRENLCYEYEEHLPEFEWNFSNIHDTICGYNCMLAESSFRGRFWKAWFTLEVPVNAGPWKFNGLPGLILKAEDSEGFFSWECLELEKTTAPLLFYEIPTKKMDRDQIYRWLRKVYSNPYEYFAGTEGKTLIIGDEKILDHTWTMPFNPLER